MDVKDIAKSAEETLEGHQRAILGLTFLFFFFLLFFSFPFFPHQLNV